MLIIFESSSGALGCFLENFKGDKGKERGVRVGRKAEGEKEKGKAKLRQRKEWGDRNS